MVKEVKEVLDGTGIKVAGWVITSVIVIVGVSFLYTKYIESKKLKVDYMISQYNLDKARKENPDFKPERSWLRKINKMIK
jgi:hypothetical protein